MAASGSSQIVLQTVESLLVRLGLQDLDTRDLKEIEAEIQDVLKSRFHDIVIHFVQNGESGVVAREEFIGNREQRVSNSCDNQLPLPPVTLSSGERETNMTSVPPHGLDMYPYILGEATATHDLKNSVLQLTEQNKELKKSLELAAADTTDLASKLDHVKRERDDLCLQQQNNKLKIRKLNEIILNNSKPPEEPLDDVFLQDMFKVRNMTTDVIRRFYPGAATFRPERQNQLKTPYYYEFYEHQIRADKSPERRRRLLISQLFLELQNLFFGPNARRFGLPEHMERSFREMEKTLETSTKVSVEECVEWRTRTVSYIGRLNLSHQGTIDNAANYLYSILRPMNLEGAESNATQRIESDLHNALRELCSAALKLSLRFRSNKTKYEFKSYDNGTSLPACEEKRVNILSSEGHISNPRDMNKLRIFCTLFGALVKTRPIESGMASGPVVLEPGQVVVYETSRSPSSQ